MSLPRAVPSVPSGPMKGKGTRDREVTNQKTGPLDLRSVPTGPLGKPGRKNWPTENRKHSENLSANWATWDRGPRVMKDIPNNHAIRAPIRTPKSAGSAAARSKKHAGPSRDERPVSGAALSPRCSGMRGHEALMQCWLPHGRVLVLLKPDCETCRKLCGCPNNNGAFLARQALRD